MKTQKEKTMERERSSTMSMAITIRFSGFRWKWSILCWKGSPIYINHVQ